MVASTHRAWTYRWQAAQCAAVVALLPPSLRELWVESGMGRCVEGAALVVPPGRAQQLELRCVEERFSFKERRSYNSMKQDGRLRTGQEGTAEDVRAFLRWHGPGGAAHVETLVLGGCPPLIQGWWADTECPGGVVG
jgi:hypothetical protein